MSHDDEDPWDVFGDDEPDDDADTTEQEEGTDATPAHHESSSSLEALALHLTQYYVRERHISQLSQIRIRTAHPRTSETFHRRGFTVIQVENDPSSTTTSTETTTNTTMPASTELVDVLFLSSDGDIDKASLLLVPGGILILSPEQFASIDIKHVQGILDVQNTISVPDNHHPDEASSSSSFPSHWILATKWPTPIQSLTCPWLPAHHNLQAERQRAAQACCLWTAAQLEQTASDGTASTAHYETVIEKAVHKLQTYGYCILPGLLDGAASQAFGEMALADLDQAAIRLWQRDGIDLRDPRNSTQEPASYRELSMREDLRMDLRHGPRLNQWRGEPGSRPTTFTALEDQAELAGQMSRPDRFLRGHPVILEIVRRTMNPSDVALAPGNWGRYNFDGRGPDGSFMDLRVGPVGAIVSLPGSADQALHADTPHLMETYDCLPAHYINVFTPGCRAHPQVGQTALVHGSHRLSYTARLEREENKMSWTRDLVRPELTLGDVLFFDCRILHFGLANTSTNVERPLIYTNMTQHWFVDPKNWDNQKPIFDDQ